MRFPFLIGRIKRLGWLELYRKISAFPFLIGRIKSFNYSVEIIDRV